MKVKKMITGALAVLMIGAVASPINSTLAAENIIIPRGDVDGNGLSTMDAFYIQRFLNGELDVTAEEFTAMDANGDGMVDVTDAYCIIRSLATGTSLGSTNILYNTPYNNYEEYLKHTCGTGSASTSLSYSISAASATINNIIDEPEIMSLQAYNDPPSAETGCVKIKTVDYNNNISWATGFIIDEHIIATSASCLYNNGFMKNVTAYIQAEETGANNTTVTAIYEAQAETIHIPSDYTITNSSYRDILPPIAIINKKWYNREG